MRYSVLDRLDPGTRGLVLVLGGGAVSWVAGPLILFVTRPQDLALVGALLGIVALAGLIVVIWGIYFGGRVLAGHDFGRRTAALVAVVIGGLTLLPWVVALFQ
jgi:hypothetical protein